MLSVIPERKWVPWFGICFFLLLPVFALCPVLPARQVYSLPLLQFLFLGPLLQHYIVQYRVVPYMKKNEVLKILPTVLAPTEQRRKSTRD
ncbi:hypothetical protein F5884DRAFT_767077 [Xylogone sp. PMI_703]|nr:hypothetical protein F5884DRAFT_767077 [Xylogone sp. PMI_703]